MQISTLRDLTIVPATPESARHTDGWLSIYVTHAAAVKQSIRAAVNAFRSGVASPTVLHVGTKLYRLKPGSVDVGREEGHSRRDGLLAYQEFIDPESSDTDYSDEDDEDY